MAQLISVGHSHVPWSTDEKASLPSPVAGRLVGLGSSSWGQNNLGSSLLHVASHPRLAWDGLDGRLA